MRLEHRLQNLELKFVTKQPGCNPTLFIVIPEDRQSGSFNSDSYRPTRDETEKYIKQLKADGHCRGCQGACSIDWLPEGFKNHTLGGTHYSSSPGPNLFMMFCADVEIPILCRQLINVGREQDK
jgi:hypothetical protein